MMKGTSRGPHLFFTMNDALTELQSTVAALSAEVAALKSKLALMEEVITVKTLPDGRLTRSVECESVVVRDAEDPRWMAIHMGTNPDLGTFLHMHYLREEQASKTAVSLSVTRENEPMIQLRGTDWKMRAGMWLDKDCGVVGVMRPGDVPAAVMKGMPRGGSMAVVQPSGRPRVAMMHLDASEAGRDDGRTELALLDAKGKPCLNLMETASGPAIRLHRGEAHAVLLAADDMVGLMVDGPDKKTSAMLVAAPEAAKVAVNQGTSGEDAMQAAAELTAGTFGGDLSLHGPDGKERVCLTAQEGGGHLRLLNQKRNPALTLHQADEKGIAQLVLHGADEKEERVSLRTTDDVSAVWVGSPHEPGSGHLTLAPQGDPLYALRVKGDTRVGLSVGESCGVVTAYGPGTDAEGPNRGGMASICGGPVAGGVVVATADGTHQAELGATDQGGRLLMNNDLGFQRIAMGVHQESAGLHLNHTGSQGVAVVATPIGGVVTVYDEDGNRTATLPPPEWSGN